MLEEREKGAKSGQFKKKGEIVLKWVVPSVPRWYHLIFNLPKRISWLEEKLIENVKMNRTHTLTDRGQQVIPKTRGGSRRRSLQL